MNPTATQSRSLGPTAIATIVAVLAIAGGAAWFYWPASSEPPVPPAPPPAQAPAPAKEAAPHHPAPEASGKPVGALPLPALDASDAALVHSLSSAIGPEAVARLLRPEALVRRIVATIDNLPRETIAWRLNPVAPVGGLLATTGRDETLAIAPANAARYAPLVRLVGALDAKRVVAVYAHYYPLFQQAYVDLGYPQGHFNTRLVQVIDHLLGAPEPREPPRLVVRRILPEFADPSLESQSAGRKILLRMGPENAAVLKAKLRELRAGIAAGPPSP